MNIGVIGGLIGAGMGLLGGLIGSWASIHNTTSARERRFVLKAVATLWLAGLVFFALLFLLPTPFKMLLWILYGILLPVAIIVWNRRQERIRREEKAAKQQEEGL
jgi:Ca2+/Na+ antiporter